MSYSLAPVRATTRAGVIAALSAAFDEKVLPGQPAHEHDKQAHLDATARQLELLPDLKEGEEYSASMGGYLSWMNDPSAPAPRYTTAGFNCSASIVAIEKPKA